MSKEEVINQGKIEQKESAGGGGIGVGVGVVGGAGGMSRPLF